MNSPSQLVDAVTILKNIKATCENCRRIDAAITQLSPLVMDGHAPIQSGNGRTPNRHTLIGSIISVLEKHETPMTPAEIMKALPSTGYQTQAKSLRSVVYPVLNRNQAKGIVMKVGEKWGLAAGMVDRRELGRWEKERTISE